MITVVTQTLSEIPKGSMEYGYERTLLVACMPHQVESVVPILEELAGDRYESIRIEKNELTGMYWVYLSFKSMVWVKDFEDMTAVLRYQKEHGYRLRNYNEEGCGVYLAFHNA